MDIAAPPLPDERTGTLMRRLWREHVRHHRGRLVVVLLLTALMAGLEVVEKRLRQRG